MRKCSQCGFENADSMKFCCQCGSSLDVKKPKICAKCGAELNPEMKFCGNCGAKAETVQEKQNCVACGAKLEAGMAFCGECGKPVSSTEKVAPAASKPNQSGDLSIAQPSANIYASTHNKPRVSFKSKAVAAKGKVMEFEKKHSVIVNGIIALLALIFIFVSLFCPIKITQTDMSVIMGESAYSDSAETYEVSQSIWQVFGAIGYLGLNASDSEDMNKIESSMSDFQKAYTEALREVYLWAATHDDATEDEIVNRFSEALADKLSDLNYLGLILGFTTIDALNNMLGEEVDESEITENMIADVLDTMRDSAILSLVFALLTAAAQLFVAVVSLVFLIFAILGMVRRKPSKLFRYMTMALIGSGAGLLMTMFGPMLAPSGAVFGIALTFALMYLILGAGKAYIEGKNVLYLAKRTVYSVCAIIALFLLCSNLLNSSVIMKVMDEKNATSSSVPLGGTMDIVLTCTGVLTIPYEGIELFYSSLSVPSAVITLILGVIVFAVLFTAMLLSLRKLAYKTESKWTVDIIMLVSIVALVLFAILPAALGAADSLPYFDSNMNADGLYNVAVQSKLSVGAYVYVAIVFAVMAFVFELIYRPKNNQALQAEASADASVSQQDEQQVEQSAETVTEPQIEQQANEQAEPQTAQQAEQPVEPQEEQPAPQQEEQPEPQSELQVEPKVEPQVETVATVEKPKAAKTPSKKTSTAATKPASKTTAKTASKTAAKPATKSTAKTATKTATKTAPKNKAE